MRRLKEKSGFVHETVEEGCGTQGAGRGFDFFLQKESLGMVLMMGAIAVLPLLFTRAGVDSFEVPKRLGWACVALVLWRLNLGGRKEGTGVDWLWGIGLLLMGWMTGRTLGMGPVFRWIHGWAAWMMPLCLFFVGYHHERSEKQKRVLGWTCLIAGAFQAGVMLLQWAGADPFFLETTQAIDYRPGRMIGTIGYQNQAAEFLVVCMAGWFWVGRETKERWIAGALLAISLVAVFLTANRGAVLALLMGWGVVAASRLWESRKRVSSCARKGLLIVAAMVASVVVLGAIPEVRARVAELAAPRESVAVQSRLEMWKTAVTLWKRNPLFGIGAGGYAWEYLPTLAERLPEEKDHALLKSLVYAREAHNDGLQFGCEFGFVGWILLGCLGVGVLRRRDGDGVTAYVLTVMAVAAFFSFTWQTVMAGPLAGFLLGSSYQRRGGSSGKRGWPVAVVAMTAVALALVGIAGYDAWWNGNPESTDGAGAHGRWKALQAAEEGVNGNIAVAELGLREALTEYRDLRVYSNLGNVLVQQGKWDEALEVYRFWMKTGLEHSEAMRNCSIVLEKQEDFDSASVLRYRRMLLFPRDFSDAEILNTASLLLRAHREGEATHVAKIFYNVCMERKPWAWTAEWENVCGVLCQRKGALETALMHYEKALQMKPTLVSAQKNAQQLKARMKKK